MSHPRHLPEAPKGPPSDRALLGCFAVSGAASLVYQVVWARLLGRVVGSDALGVALCLAVFMLGLGLGAPLFARRALAARRPLVFWTELATLTACLAALSLLALEALPPLPSLWQRGLLSALVLLPPTLVMGGTIPAMAEAIRSGEHNPGGDTARFYAANTWGAAIGALLGTFLWMPLLGLRATLGLAALIEVAVALWARTQLARNRDQVPAPAQAPPRGSPWPLSGARGRLALVAAALGASGLGFEVLATRALTGLMGASAYAFALVLTVFLSGLAGGAAWMQRRLRAPARSPQPVALGLALLPPAMLLGFLLLTWRSGGGDPFEGAVNLVTGSAGALGQWAATALLACLCLLPGAWLLGAALPALVARLGPPAERAPADIAALYCANSIGSAAGALLTSLVAIPALGMWGAFELGFLWSALALLALAPSHANSGPSGARRRAWTVWGLGLGLSVVLAQGLGWGRPPPGTLYARAGAVSTAQVRGSDDPSLPRSLLIDGKVVASSAPIDARLQVLLGALPLWLHGGVQSAFVIGLGSGMTAGVLLVDPGLVSLDVVEISTAVAGATDWFKPWNRDLLADPRCRLQIGDGRHRLATSKRRFDLVTSDPIHPWTRGSSDLYALEHFRAMAEHLAPRGIASQWLPLYQLSEADQKTVIATWCGAFKHTAACLTAYDLVLLGAVDRELEPLDQSTQDAWPLGPGLAQALEPLGIQDACDLAALWVADDRALRQYAAGASPMTSDRPVLEFRAPLSFQRGYSRETLAWAGRDPAGLPLPPCSGPEAHRIRALLARFREASQGDWRAASEAYGRALVEHTPER